MSSYDHLIKGGRVIDPANNIDGVMDVAIAAGKITAVEADLQEDQAQQVYDVSGKLVVPGLIDIHMHGYNHVTPLGLDTDHYCLGRGGTTAADAGSASRCTAAELTFVTALCTTIPAPPSRRKPPPLGVQPLCVSNRGSDSSSAPGAVGAV